MVLSKTIFPSISSVYSSYSFSKNNLK